MFKHSAFSVFCLALATHAVAGEPLPLYSLRVALPAQVKRADHLQTLLPRTPLQGGDRVLTGARGRATLQLAGIGTLTLGGDAELYVHSTELTADGAIAKVKLERGALRIDGRFRQGAPPQDFRINAGRVRLRVYGAEVWTEVTPRGENVCLLSGAIEIQRDEGSDRIDNPGDCLLYSGEGRRLLVTPDQQETLARKLLRTAFAEDYTTRIAAQNEAATAPEPAPPALPPPAAAAPVGAHGWTLVAASIADEAAAEHEAQRLRAIGLPAEVRLAETGSHRRVTVGRFETPAQAREFAERARSEHGLVDLWLLRF